MPQSNVSEAVARLREQGTVEPFPDRLRPDKPGPILDQLDRARSDPAGE